MRLVDARRRAIHQGDHEERERIEKRLVALNEEAFGGFRVTEILRELVVIHIERYTASEVYVRCIPVLLLLVPVSAGCLPQACAPGTHEEGGVCVPDERTPTALPEGEVIEGGFTVENGDDVEALANVIEITGDLTLSDGPAEVEFPRLQRVGGVFFIDERGVEVLRLPALTHIDGSLFNNGSPFSPLREVHAPVLEAVGYMGFTGMDDCTDLTFPALREVGAIGLEDMVGLTRFSAPDVETASSLYLGNTRLPDVDLGSLSALPEGLDLRDNPVLASLEGLAGLQTIGNYVAVVDNPSLPTCDVVDFLDAVTFDGTPEVVGNAACP